MLGPGLLSVLSVSKLHLVRLGSQSAFVQERILIFLFIHVHFFLLLLCCSVSILCLQKV